MMGFLLYRMLRAGMPPEWASGMRLVALIIADDANDETRLSWIRNEQLCEETGLTPRGVRDALQALGDHDYEMRVSHGTDKRGRPVYAARGHSVDYRVPIMPPRPPRPSKEAPECRLWASETASETAPKAALERRKGGTDLPKGGTVVPPLSSDLLTIPSSTKQLLTEPSVEGNGSAPDQDHDFDDLDANKAVLDRLSGEEQSRLLDLAMRQLPAGFSTPELVQAAARLATKAAS